MAKRGGGTELPRERRAHRGKDICLVGGAGIIRESRDPDLIDDYIITCIPVVLCEGIPLFPTPGSAHALQLAGSKSFSSEFVQATYSRMRP